MVTRPIDSIIENAKKYSATVLRDQSREIDQEGQFPAAHFAHFADLGVLRIPFQRQRGGLDGNLQDILTTIQLIAQNCASTASVLLTQISFGIAPLHDYGTPEQKDQYLPDLFSGKQIGAFAMNELHAGSQVTAMKTTAIETEDGWELTGAKDYISLVGQADFYTVASRIQTLAGAEDYGIFLVPAATKGVYISEKIEKMGMRGLPVGDLRFESVQLKQDALIGGRAGGVEQIQAIKEYNQLFVAAQALGLAIGVFEETLAYMQKDRRFGQQLIDLADNQDKMAIAYSEIYATRTLIESLEMFDPHNRRLHSLVKLKASNLAVETAEMAIALTGGYGYMGDSTIERYVRDAKLTQIYGGSSQTQMKILAEPWLKKNKKENR